MTDAMKNPPIEGAVSYTGAKTIDAMPMKLGAYNDYRGWDIPDDEDPDTDGYIVQYADGYISWSPAPQFEEAYRMNMPKHVRETLNFPSALTYVIKGKQKLARAGWNGKGMFIFLVAGSEFEVNRAPLNEIYPEGSIINYNQHVDIRTADGSISVWQPSNGDMCANDWYIVEQDEIDEILIDQAMAVADPVEIGSEEHQDIVDEASGDE